MYGLILTTAGATEIESAYQAGTVVVITHAEIGDGDGAPVSSDPAALAEMTEVIGLFGSVPFSDSQPDEGLLNGQFVINCQAFPGKVLRMVGLRSSTGTLIACGGYPDTFLPAQTDSIIKEVILTCVLTLVHSESVELLIDPETRILTQSLGDDLYLNEDENLADVPDKVQARNNLEVYSKTESDGRYEPLDSAYTKSEADARFEPIDSAYTKGEADARFEPIDSAYTKGEADSRFQPKGNYAPANSSYTKAESDGRYEPLDSAYTKSESDNRYLTPAAAASTYVQNAQRGALGSVSTPESSATYVPAGCFQVGVWLSGDGSTGTHVETIYYRPLQIYRNGQWVTISG